MKLLKILLLSIITFVLISTFAFAAGDIKKGKALFNDPKLGGGTSGKSCNSCHPDGNGLEQFIEQNENDSTNKKLKSPEHAVNACIKNPMKGVGMDIKGADMVNVIAYIKSLKKPAKEPMKMQEKKLEKSKKKTY